MKIAEILTVNRIIYNPDIYSKKRLLQAISDTISCDLPQQTSQSIFTAFVERERLGSTNLNHGVAVPHCRVHTNRMLGCLITTPAPIDYDDSSDTGVDLCFALVVPEDASNQYLEVLATLSQAFNDGGFRDELRKAKSATEIYQLIVTKCDG